MSRRAEALLLAAVAVLLAALAACGGDHGTAPAKPIARAKPEAAAAPASNSASPAPTPPPAAAPAPDTQAAQTKPAAPPAPEPPYTPGTSLPGAIPPSPAPPETNADASADPLKWMQDRENNRADYTRKIAEAEANLATAQAAVGAWQNNILAFKNPFRPRPQLSPEDAQAIEGKDGIWRVQWAEGKLGEATAARESAQKALDDLKANPPN